MDLSELNPAQRQAVMHDDGPMLVVAGAGTGKTHVITSRIARLVTEEKAKPEEILALTFTDKAAGEMLDRLDTLIGWQAYRVNVMTFHAFGAQLLQRFGHHMGWSTRAEIIPDLAKVILLKQQLGKVKLSYYGRQDDLIDFLEGQIQYIEALQNADISLEAFRKYVDAIADGDDHPLDIAEARDRLALFELYEKIKHQNGVIDYNDQIQLPLELLEAKPNLAQKLGDEFKYVLVDEYQDTNAAQDGLLRAFVPKGGNIFAVGDDDQAIYGFRGAKLGNILSFSEYFGVNKPIVLTENYRSSQPILDAAYRLIQHNNPDRLEAKLGLDKHLHGQTNGVEPVFEPYATAQDELEGVAAGLRARLSQGAKPNDIAVLATSHTVLRTLAKVLRSRQVPHKLSSSINIFEQPEIMQLWHLLRWIGMVASDEAVSQLLFGPFVEWPDNRVRQMLEVAKRELTTLEETVTASTEPDAQQLTKNLVSWRGWAKRMPVSQLVYQLIFETGLSDTWIKQAEDSPRMVRVFEDLQLLLRQMQQFESAAVDPTLASYLENFPKAPEIRTEEVVGDENGVALLTIHASKGLEFESVYIINNTADAWGERATGRRVALPESLLATAEELPPEHERRRLMYVALTRAKQNLVLTAPMQSASGRSRKLNPFLVEALQDLPSLEVSNTETSDKLKKSLQELQRFSPYMVQNQAVALPFENDGWLELTTSDIDAYDYCPYEFFLERVLKIRTPLGPQANFGTLLHDLFRDYYQGRQAKEPLTLAQLQQRLEDRWSDRGYRTSDEAAVAHETAIKTLEAFYKREESSDRMLVASEETISLSLDEAKLRIRGRIDARFTSPEGDEVRDFKTGRAHDAEKLSKQAKESLQLRTYALAVEAMTGKSPDRVVLDYIVTGTEGVATLSPVILKNHRQKLADIADKIRDRQFAPKDDMFHSCIARRYWGNGDEE